MKIKAQKEQEKNKICFQCNKTISKSKTSVIRLTSYDSTRRYNNSKRKFINNLIIRLCQKCYTKVINKLTKTITLI